MDQPLLALHIEVVTILAVRVNHRLLVMAWDTEYACGVFAKTSVNFAVLGQMAINTDVSK